MASLLQAIRECLIGADNPKVDASSKESAMAADVLKALFTAEKGGSDLKKTVKDIVGEYGWTENIAKAILGGLVNALNEGLQMGQAMKEAFDKAVSEATEFARDHPIFCTVIALGILVILMPWVLEALGFAELGPVEGNMNPLKSPVDANTTYLGTFAAWWQSTYAGEVPGGSLFSFFQRLGMVWRRSVVGKLHPEALAPIS